jgi:hypothetical protein
MLVVVRWLEATLMSVTARDVVASWVEGDGLDGRAFALCVVC